MIEIILTCFLSAGIFIPPLDWTVLEIERNACGSRYVTPPASRLRGENRGIWLETCSTRIKLTKTVEYFEVIEPPDGCEMQVGRKGER